MVLIMQCKGVLPLASATQGSINLLSIGSTFLRFFYYLSDLEFVSIYANNSYLTISKDLLYTAICKGVLPPYSIFILALGLPPISFIFDNNNLTTFLELLATAKCKAVSPL